MLFRSLFKSSDVSSCIDLVYITGILPIKRYTTQSALNMFIEYNMLNPYSLAEFIGFTEEEVKGLCDEYKADFNELKKWYNGYYYKSVGAIYSPKSVTMAISTGICSDYWTSTSAIEAVSNYMNYDNGVLKSEITRMIAGEKITVDVNDFENDLTKVDSKDTALTVLIHLGYLAYDIENRQCYIPNYEIKQKFERAIKKVKWMEIYTPISKSKELYYETLKGNTSYIDEFFNEMHSTFATQFNKNKEDVLGLLVHLSYYYCSLDYDIKKEEVSILGRADISFIPKMNDKIPLIIELKADDKTSALDAVRQIKEKEYFNSLSSYKGEVILLKISYNSKTMKHHSHIEKTTV